MLWHLCDICCHNSERKKAAQVLFLSPEINQEANMLAQGKMVGFVPTTDYEKARAFYEGKLGFEFISLDQYALVMSVGGHKIRIAKVPNFTPLQGTILGWEVQDIQAVASWLRDRGVTVEKYPFVQDRDLGIWTTPTGDRVAWFKDPDGNILGISQHAHPAAK
jgi:catechol 2,3-dioxygenase-like lactoylglutathione lyase family enzyme